MGHKLYEFETVYLKQEINKTALVSKNDAHVILELIGSEKKYDVNSDDEKKNLVGQYQLVVVPSNRIEIVVESNHTISVSSFKEFFENCSYKIMDEVTPQYKNNLYIYKFELQCSLNINNHIKPFHMNAVHEHTHSGVDQKFANMTQLSILTEYYSSLCFENYESVGFTSGKQAMFENYLNSLIISNLEYLYPLCFNKIIRDKYAQHSLLQTQYNKLGLNFHTIVLTLLAHHDNTTFMHLLNGGGVEYFPVKTL